ncbi:MAG: serine/threonine-protein kinase [Myxococcales bacterium]
MNLPKPGDILAAKYRVERLLGQGGMGIVVAARHLELDDWVAIKFLLPQMLEHPTIVARFLVEAKAARRIKSEHAAKVTDVGTLPETGAPYMVMELLEGIDLAGLLAQSGPMPVAMAVEYILQACEALAEAHIAGIVHRDLKPANLFRTRRADGSACIKVLDFGIAKLTQDSTGPALTRTTGMVGTALYASPEQLQSPHGVDSRADIWSLGALLFELLTAHVPFVGDSLPVVIAQVIAMPPTPLGTYRPELQASIGPVLARCLEKDRDRRYANVADFAQALAPFAFSESLPSVARIVRTMQAAGIGSGSVVEKCRRPSGTTNEPDTGVASMPYRPITGGSALSSTRQGTPTPGRKGVLWAGAGVLVVGLAATAYLGIRVAPKATVVTAEGSSSGRALMTAEPATSAVSLPPPSAVPSPSASTPLPPPPRSSDGLKPQGLVPRTVVLPKAAPSAVPSAAPAATAKETNPWTIPEK